MSVVNEYLTNVRMAEERGRAGTKALSDWLGKCREAVGEMKGSTSMKLLAELVLLDKPKYVGVEDGLGQWRKYRCGQLESCWEWGDSIHQYPDSLKCDAAMEVIAYIYNYSDFYYCAMNLIISERVKPQPTCGRLLLL